MKFKFNEIQSETGQLRQIVSSINGNVRRHVQGSVHHEIIAYLESLLHDRMRLSEEFRREKELREKIEAEAATAAANYQKVTSDMMTKLNSLQTRSEPLYDDQCTSGWRKLQQALDVWTRRTFMDKSALSRMTAQDVHWASPSLSSAEDMLQNIQRKRAYIQGFVAQNIFDAVFDHLFACSPNKRSDKLLTVMGRIVKESGSSYSYTWETWRLTTSKALDNAKFEDHRLEQACTELLMKVETLFGNYYSPNITKENFHRALHQLFRDCLTFKKKLERQECDYVIRQSPCGAVYSAGHMNSLNFMEEDGSIVEMSVWPSLHKLSFDNEELLIGSVAVWTKKSNQVDNSGTGELYDIEKEIKHELNTEGDDDDEDELALIMH